MNAKFFSFLVFLFGVQLSAQDGYPRQEGLDVVHYKFQLEINDETDEILGWADVDLKLLHNTKQVQLDLVKQDDSGKGMLVEEVLLEGKNIDYEQVDDQLVLFLPPTLSKDSISIGIGYKGIPIDGLIISKNKY